jgi:hypothetical protein
MQSLAFVQSLVAGAIGVACLALLAHQFLPARLRHRLDARIGRLARALSARTRRVVRWPSAHQAARREAEAAIRRAREKAGEWDGNVYRPKSFRKPRKLH